MVSYPNFFETVAEAEMRLQNGVVLYDGEPYEVAHISNTRQDGIFRIYMTPFGKGTQPPQEYYDAAGKNPGLNFYTWLDKWIDGGSDKAKQSGWARKMMNSPLFNKFRPFDLGMCTYNGRVGFIERHPTRRTMQALTINSVQETALSLDSSHQEPRGLVVRWGSQPMIDMIKGVYPTAQQCVEELQKPTNNNSGVAFHRNFAILKGPLRLLFLAYKTNVIGLLPNRNLSEVHIAQEFQHYREVTEALRVFGRVAII